MTQKDYQLVARGLNTAYCTMLRITDDRVRARHLVTWETTVAAVKQQLAAANPKFNPEKFDEACRA